MKVVLGGVYSSYHVITDNLILYEFFQKLLQYDRDDLLLHLFKGIVKKKDLTITLDILKMNLKQFRGDQKKLLEKIIHAYEYQVELSNLYLAKGDKYDPIRLEILDEPYHLLSRNIPLEDYDNNEGDPFWMRPEYIIEKYGKNTQIQINTITPTSFEHKATYRDGKLEEGKR